MWTATVLVDTDKIDVGVAIATWDKGLGTEFTYSRRAQMTVADKNAFVIEAKAALTAFQNKATNNTTYSTSLATALNT